jgi:succinate dehydrogenase hydrophobic anchor subunit
MHTAENAWLWIVKAGAGLFIVFVMGLHFIVNHAISPDGLLSYADVVRYYQNPWVVAMEIFFLVFVVGHALLGLRGILLDLNPSPRVMFFANRIFILAGLFAVVYGIWLALIVAGKNIP